MTEPRVPEDQRQLAHFRDGGEVEMLTLSELEYSALKANLAQSRSGLETKAEPDAEESLAASEHPRPPAPDAFAAYQRGVDDSLRDYFEGFLRDGHPGDKHFLLDVFVMWDNTRLPSRDGHLAQAVADTLDITVPAAA